MPRIMNEHNKNSFKLFYLITTKCNNRCPYCSVNSLLTKNSTFEEDVFEKLIEKTNELHDKNYKIRFGFGGGEPLLEVEKVKKFIERTNCDSYIMYSNMNFAPDSTRLAELKRILEDHENVLLCTSWHDVSNAAYVKENISNFSIYNQLVILPLHKNNFDDIYEKSKWLSNKNYRFRISIVQSSFVQNFDLYTDFSNEKFKEIQRLSIGEEESNIIIDGKLYSEQEFCSENLINMSHNYLVKCHLSHFNILPNGKIVTGCDYNYENSLSAGFVDKYVMCKNKCCVCSTHSYRELYQIKGN